MGSFTLTKRAPMPGIEGIGPQSCEADPSLSPGIRGPSARGVHASSVSAGCENVCVEPHPGTTDIVREALKDQLTKALDHAADTVAPGGQLTFAAQLRVGDPAVVVNLRFQIKRDADGKGLSVMIGGGAGLGASLEALSLAGGKADLTLDSQARFHFDDIHQMNRLAGSGLTQALEQGFAPTTAGLARAAALGGGVAKQLLSHLEEVTVSITGAGKESGTLPLGGSSLESVGHADLQGSVTVRADGWVIQERELHSDQRISWAVGLEAGWGKAVIEHSGFEGAFAVTAKVRNSYRVHPELAEQLRRGEITGLEFLKRAATQMESGPTEVIVQGKAELAGLEVTGTKTFRPEVFSSGKAGALEALPAEFEISHVDRTTVKAGAHAEVASLMVVSGYETHCDGKKYTSQEVKAAVLEVGRHSAVEAASAIARMVRR